MSATRKILALLAAVALFAAGSADAALLFSDNFNVADTTNFDGASTAGRLGGSLASTVFLRSARAQQHIAGNQLRMVSANSGRVRVQDAGGWYDWAAGTEGGAILGDGGLRVEFDLTTVNTTTSNWVSFNIGHPGSSVGEPNVRITDNRTDYGILFRGNGGTQRFDNGAATITTTATPSAGQQHVVIDLAFNSFADGTNVSAVAAVEGKQVDYHNFTWDSNAGELYMELGTTQTGMLVDNYSISTLPATSMTPAVSGHNGAVRYIPINDDDNSGISAAKTYTHTLDFGSSGAANVNGVAFDAAGPGTLPGGSGTTNLPSNHGGNGNHGIPGTEGVAALFQDMIYNASQGIITLMGLTPGQAYDTRLYMRNWESGSDTNDRSQMFMFDTNADGVSDRALRINPDDSSQNAPDFADNHQPYAMSYVFVAESDELSIRVNQLGGGTYHLYGLTNEETNRRPIETLFSTGLDANGDRLADNTPDPHYTLLPGAAQGTTALAIANNTAWAPNDAGSGFIGVASGATSVAGGSYDYETTFDLTGFLPWTAELVLTMYADDSVDDILLNGVSTGITATGFNYGAGRTVTISSGFLPGLNTLEFQTTNGSTSPAGFRLDLSGTAILIPEPTTLLIWSLLAGLGAGLGWRRRKYTVRGRR